MPDLSSMHGQHMQQHHGFLQSSFESASYGPAAGGHVENDALKAAAAALDRAEVDMLMGGRIHRSPEPGMNLGGDWPPLSAGDAFRRGGSSSNFALQAAADALGGGDEFRRGRSSNN